MKKRELSGLAVILVGIAVIFLGISSMLQQKAISEMEQDIAGISSMEVLDIEKTKHEWLGEISYTYESTALAHFYKNISDDTQNLWDRIHLLEKYLKIEYQEENKKDCTTPAHYEKVEPAKKSKNIVYTGDRRYYTWEVK